MSDSIIKVENLGKSYFIGHQKQQSYTALRDVVAQKVKGLTSGIKNTLRGQQLIDGTQIEEFWALKDINFEIKQGEAVGIIGRNGAGKSTLLKVLSRITEPTIGRITLKGRVASLLEVGTGFHPELSGRENIYLNGSILGMSRSEIRKKFDEIVDFSGVEKFLDTPVKRYSSGMYVRLAFSVAAHLEPEILVVDEVLAVGDAEFQKKCLGKMDEVSRNEGRTVLFVSHNIEAVRNLCTKGLCLDRGQLVCEGNLDNVIAFYSRANLNLHNWVGEDGDEVMKLLETKVSSGSDIDDFKNVNPVQILVKVELGQSFKDILLGITLRSATGNPIVGTLYNDYNELDEIQAGQYEIIFTIPPSTLATGHYELEVNLSIPYVKRFSTKKSNLFFSVSADNSYGNRFFTQNDPFLNSVLRPDWFTRVKKLK